MIPEATERRFRRSALAGRGSFLTTEEAVQWLLTTAERSHLSVRQVALDSLEGWVTDPKTGDIHHKSGKFFHVHGLRVRIETADTTEWEQPILDQPEIGILGIMAKEFDGQLHFLMQAKMEPGNPLGVQMVPTVQATRSNYTQVHQGARPRYVDHMLDRGLSRVLVDQLQYEQGTAFFRKRNRNIVVEVTGDVPVVDGYQWLTLGQIKAILRTPNLVSMDTRTVISCIPLMERGGALSATQSVAAAEYGFGPALLASAAERERGAHSTNEVLQWITDLKCRWWLGAERINLKSIRCWTRSETEIAHDKGQFFRVIGVNVEADSREVSGWSQPLLAPSGKGLLGFLVRRMGGVLQFLVQANVEPGNVEAVALGPTVQCSLGVDRAEGPSSPPFADVLAGAPDAWIRFSVTQSEEGGRFYRLESEYRVVELPEDQSLPLPENFRWMTLGQINEMLRFGLVNVEARNVLSCLSFADPSSDR